MGYVATDKQEREASVIIMCQFSLLYSHSSVALLVIQAISPITFTYCVETFLPLLQDLQFYFEINFPCTVFLFYYTTFTSPEGQDAN